MLKSVQLHTRLTRNLVVVAILLLLAVGTLAIGFLLPVQADPLAQEQDATPTPGSMMDDSMMGDGMSMAEMGAMMDQMMANMNSMMAMMPVSGTMPMSGAMPMSGTMSMADIGMMMQMMGMMQMHMGQMQMMMGAMMSGDMMGSGMMDGMMGDTSGMDMPSDVPFDAMFIDSMIEHHQGAIDMAEMALEQAEHEELQTLAEDIIAAQTTEIEQMQSWRSEWYPDLAATGGMQMGMGEMMIGEDESKPFDQRFIEAMISHHQGAIDMAEMALEQAEHEEIRTLAEEIIAAQIAEIEQMQGWLADWYDVSD